MDFKVIKDSIDLKEFAEAHLEHAGGGLVCPNPNCRSGTGKNHSPAFRIYKSGTGREYWHCFSCDHRGDVLDLAMEIGSFQSIKEAAEYVAGWAGIDTSKPLKRIDVPQKKVEPEPDYTEGRAKEREYRKQRHNLEALKKIEWYLKSRGYTPEKAYELGFGYDASKGGARDEEGNWCKIRGRLIIPWLGSDYYHIDRSVDPSAKIFKYDKPKRPEVGNQPLFNPDAIKDNTVFICEGALDALAVIAVGGSAMALGGSSSYGVIKHLRENKYEGTVVAMLDNDKTGRESTAKLIEALRVPSNEFGSSVKCIEFDWGKDALRNYKDAAEILADNKDLLEKSIAAYIKQLESVQKQDAPIEANVQEQKLIQYVTKDTLLKEIKESSKQPTQDAENTLRIGNMTFKI